jgi:hypothetical protein
MSELSQLLGDAAEPHKIEHDGKVFAFRLLTGKRRNELEKRLYQNARQLAFAEREDMTSEEYATRLQLLADAYEAGEFGFTGTRGQKVMQTQRGVMLLLEVITGETEDSLLALIAARGAEVNAVLKAVMTESIPGLKVKP